MTDNQEWEDLAKEGTLAAQRRAERESQEQKEPQGMGLDKEKAFARLDPDRPPKIHKDPKLEYRDPRKMKPKGWEYYLALTRAASEDHAKAYFILQGWDMDMGHSYFQELRIARDKGETLKTAHETIEREDDQMDVPF